MNTATDQPLHDRRARTRAEIKQLIAERNSVLSQYYHLANQAEQAIEDREALIDQLQEFCQDLVDYLATGHFEIYRRIEEGKERRDEMLQLAGHIYDNFTRTTQAAVEFNDLYDLGDGSNVNDALEQLPAQLSRLGEELATRIDLEDRFINTLLTGRTEKKSTDAQNA